jgi:hypothetical protein
MKYKFEAWVHPRTGDDYAIIGSIVCSTQETAYKHIKKILKREKSTILTDFTISVIPE